MRTWTVGSRGLGRLLSENPLWVWLGLFINDCYLVNQAKFKTLWFDKLFTDLPGSLPLTVTPNGARALMISECIHSLNILLVFSWSTSREAIFQSDWNFRKFSIYRSVKMRHSNVWSLHQKCIKLTKTTRRIYFPIRLPSNQTCFKLKSAFKIKVTCWQAVQWIWCNKVLSF